MSGFHLLVRGDQGIYTFTFWAYFAVSAADLLHWCWCGDHVNIDGRWCLLCTDTASHHWLSSPHHPLLELDTAVGALNKQAELLFPRILNTKQILWSDNEDWDWEHSLHRFYLNLLLHLLLLLHFTTRLAAVLWGDLREREGIFDNIQNWYCFSIVQKVCWRVSSGTEVGRNEFITCYLIEGEHFGC